MSFMTEGWSGPRAFARAAGWCMAIAAGLAGHGAAAAEYTVAATPGWVRPATLPQQPRHRDDQIVNGTFHVLIDTQVRALGADRVQYRRYAIEALNAAGVESIANIEIGFDPSYQSLTLHSLDVIRDGHATSRLADAQVRMLQRESALEYRIYDGRKTANIFLEDVRVGDTIDYSYSLRGSNPVFAGRTFGTVLLQYNEPVGRIHARLVVDGAHPLAVHPRNTALVATEREAAGAREYEWSVDDVEPLLVENDAPDWYDPYPLVQWSAFDGWAAVATWAAPLYAQAQAPGASLRAEVERIAAAQSAPAARAMAALQFVQGEIRYLGVEIGASSHAPNPPDLVLKRRFGDCKDKTGLLVAMLHALHIEATPALVNTSIGRAIEDRLPGPDAFNHVIARVRVDGKDYWLDPTRPRQEGTGLDQVFQPDFGRALVVDAATTALVAMDNPSARASLSKTHVVLDAREGFDKAVAYTVTTTSRGGRAEVARDRLRTRPRDDMQKDALNFYARSWPHIGVAAPMESHNDVAENAMTLVEHYTLSDLASDIDGGRRIHAEFAFPDTEDVLAEPAATVRHAPLGRAYPFEATTTTEILLPMKASIKAESSRVDDPAFTFERSIAATDDRSIVVTDRYVALADHVDATDVARFATHLRKARNSLDYSLEWPGKVRSLSLASINTPAWLSMLLALALSIVASRRLYRWDPMPLAIERRGAPSGLSGWLVLPNIGLFSGVVIGAYSLWLLLGLDADAWRHLTDPASAAYHAMWKPVLLFEIADATARGVLSVLLIVLMFKRRTSLPRLLPAFLWLQLLTGVVDSILYAPLPVDADGPHGPDTSIARLFFASLIWTAYFMQSARVRATFVRRYGKADVAVDATPSAAAADATDADGNGSALAELASTLATPRSEHGSDSERTGPAA